MSPIGIRRARREHEHAADQNGPELSHLAPTASFGALAGAVSASCGARAGHVACDAVSAVEVSERSFEPLVLHRSAVMPVVVDFWAPWCAPCLALAPLLEAAAAARKGQLTLVKVDVDLCPALWQRYEVRNVPAVKAFRDGEVVAEFTGLQPPDVVERFFDELVAAHARVAPTNGV
jgi:thioredoxin